MLPSLVIKLLRSSNLHTIHTSYGTIDPGNLGIFNQLDNLEEGETTGIVSNYEILLYARFYTYYQ
jgi:hypothetical protein